MISCNWPSLSPTSVFSAVDTILNSRILQHPPPLSVCVCLSVSHYDLVFSSAYIHTTYSFNGGGHLAEIAKWLTMRPSLELSCEPLCYTFLATFCMSSLGQIFIHHSYTIYSLACLLACLQEEYHTIQFLCLSLHVGCFIVQSSS